MVTTVSIDKKSAKTTKKLNFSNPISEDLEFNMGIKRNKVIPIFKHVVNMNVNPTLSLLFCFTKSKIETIIIELNEKKK
jgi:hypothetical protein